MRTYLATLTATFEVTAENAAQARLAAKRIRSLGEVAGSRRDVHERDATSYRVRRVSERVTWERSGT